MLTHIAADESRKRNHDGRNRDGPLCVRTERRSSTKGHAKTQGQLQELRSPNRHLRMLPPNWLAG
jgi:hypothetical protein